ncbi:hypothetical protein AMTR_s00080p00161300 [Amborella trichopoda]|uniref:DUF659 domain-containing protein n=1 Tax=Amborella trichopoda TaxID=13333 RepID=W1PBH6_AMBTC|nr:hypothetical protein AMTR_s00080p00161300 [Amborella trichopoda]
MFNAHEREEVDAAVARFFYAHGIPFNIANGPRFHEMVYAINNEPKGYMPPKYDKIRKSLLDKEMNRIKRALAPLRNDWTTYGVSIVSNALSNIKNEYLIIVLAAYGGRAMFLNGHDLLFH